MAVVSNSTYAYVESSSNTRFFIQSGNLNSRGTWVNSAFYVRNDVVTYLGADFICLSDNINTPPDGDYSAQWSILVLVVEGNGSASHTADEAYALAGSAYSIAVFGSYYTDTKVSQGSNFAFDLFVAGTNYALSLSQGGAGSIIEEHGSQFSLILRDQGTNYTNSQIAVEVIDRIAGDAAVAQQGSNFSYGLYVAGTTYANSIAGGSSGSQFSLILRDQGTNYTNSQIQVSTQQGSNYAYNLYVAGTAYANSIAGGATGSQFSLILRDQGTNYTNSQIAVAVQIGSQYSTILRDQGTNYTDSKVAVAVQNGSQLSTILRDQGTNYTNSQLSVEIQNRINGDSTVSQQGSNFSYGLYVAGTNFALSLSQGGAGTQIAQNGSQFSLILRDQGTNYTTSQIAIEVANRTAADLLVERHGSELAFDLYWQGTNISAATQLSDAGVANDGAGLSTTRVGNNLPIKRLKAGTNIALENNGTNVKVGVDTVNTAQTNWVGPSVGQIATTAYAGTVVLDFGSQAYSTITLTGNLFLSTTGMVAGRGISARLIGDVSDRTLSFAGGIRFIGTRPTTLAANKIAIVSFCSYSNDLSNVVAAYNVEQ
jgi:hypothetical protein